jgi:PKD repeat protein
VRHYWQFFNDVIQAGPYSSTTVASPRHTFSSATSTKRVVHKIKITSGGQTVTKTCEKNITVSCTDALCLPEYYFDYQVIDCTVFITQQPALGAPITWDFGDGFSVVSTDPPSHTYAQSGAYIITLNFNGKICQREVIVSCSGTVCCTAAFSGQIMKECGVLKLVLDAECNEGTHNWAITTNSLSPCMEVIGITQSPNQLLQITNINTTLTNQITVTHTYTCTDGTSIVETQTLDIPALTQGGIFIGIDNQNTKLTAYDCVLPDALYTGANIVFVSGRVEVDKTFAFEQTDIQFESGNSGFDVKTGSKPLSLSKGTVLRAAVECPCLWRGLRVSLDGKLVSKDNVSIEDALFGINVNSTTAADISVSMTKFNRNFIGIRGTNGSLGLSKFEENVFDGTGTLKNLCELSVNGIIIPTQLGGSLGQVTYQTERGYAGIYLNRIGFLDLKPLMPAKQNVFKNLAFGIIALEGNLKVNKNSTFSNIFGGAYTQRSSAAIFFYDGTTNSANTLRLFGNIADGGPAMVANSARGVWAQSRQGTAATKIGIADALFDGVRTGIFLDAQFMNGGFFGKPGSEFSGINNNVVLASLNSPDLVADGGIVFWDLQSSVSEVEIYNNDVTLTYSNGGTFSGGSAAIAGIGNYPASDPGNDVIEVDIHDNKVTLATDGTNGIALGRHPNGKIRNHLGNNGVFINSGTNFTSGISAEDGNDNQVNCNNVTTSSSPLEGLLFLQRNTMSNYLNNSVTGNGTGVKFSGDCSGTQFRCNLMQNNDRGLFYGPFALTGHQGSSSNPYGNRWITATIGAEADGNANALNSKFWVKAVNNENPNPILGPLGWFNLVPGNTPTCLTSCPDNLVAARFSSLDAADMAIADGSGTYANYPFPIEAAWKDRYLLYKKLFEYPNLVQSHPSLQTFIGASNNAKIATLQQLYANVATANRPAQSIRQATEANNAVIESLEGQIRNTISNIEQSTVSTRQGYLHQLDSLNKILSHTLHQNDSLAQIHAQSRNVDLTYIHTQLNTLSGLNTGEENLRQVLKFYVQYTAIEAQPNAADLALLEHIATQCPLQGGPGVGAAKGLYQAHTGTILADGPCIVPDREKKQDNKQIKALLYPNPNRGAFRLEIPEFDLEGAYSIQVLNTIGLAVMDMPAVTQRITDINLNTTPSGLYFVVLKRNGIVILNTPVLIQN